VTPDPDPPSFLHPILHSPSGGYENEDEITGYTISVGDVQRIQELIAAARGFFELEDYLGRTEPRDHQRTFNRLRAALKKLEEA
jgi:hypothetical protein